MSFNRDSPGYELLSLVATYLMSERDYRGVISDVFEMLLKNLAGDTILLYGLKQEPEERQLSLIASESLQGGVLTAYNLRFGEGLAGMIANLDQEVHFKSLTPDQLEPEILSLAKGKACFGYPLNSQDGAQGVLIFLFRAKTALPNSKFLASLAGLFANYLKNVSLRRELFRTKKKFTMLNDYQKVFSGTLDLRPVLSVFMNLTASALSAEVGIFVIFKDGSLEPELEINWGISFRDLTNMHDGQGGSFLATVIAKCQIFHLKNYGGLCIGSGIIGSLLAGAIFAQSKPVGILVFANKRSTSSSFETGFFSDEDIELFEVMRDQVANSVNNYRLYREIVEIKNYNENILQSIQSGVISVDLDGLIRAVNRRAEVIAGVQENYVGKHISEMFAIRDFSPEVLKNTIQSGCLSTQAKEVEYQDQQGETRILSVVNSPLYGDSRLPIGIVIAIEDMTERRILERQIARAEQLAALGELSAGLAHELRNPLTAIKGFAQLLPKRLNDQAFLEKFSQVVLTEITRLSDLVDQLVVFARPSTGDFKKYRLQQVLDDTLLLVGYQLEKANISTKILVSDSIGEIYCQPGRLKQVFLNILINSLQAMPDGGEIQIQIDQVIGLLPPSKRGEIIRLVFKDSGIGIPQDKIERIFNPFFTSKENGTGLGLAISYRTIEEHGGVIEVESEPRVGTLVRVLLPLAEES